MEVFYLFFPVSVLSQGVKSEKFELDWEKGKE